MTATRVAVIGDEMSLQHELFGVTGALTAAGYAVELLVIDDSGSIVDGGGRTVGLAVAVQELRSCAVAIPMWSSHPDRDRKSRALCELAGLPCVECPPRAAALGSDTWATRLVGEAVGIRVAHGVLVTRENAHHLAGLLAADLPLAVRPVAAGAGSGRSVALTQDQLVGALEMAFVLDERVLVDEVVHGREITVAVLGRADGTRIVAPALEVAVPTQRLKELEVAAVTMYDALGCAGVARVDFFLTGAGPVLDAVDPLPGFAPQSPVARAFAANSMAYEALLEMLVTDAQQLARHRRAMVAR